MGLPCHRPESAHCQNNHSETATCSLGASAPKRAALAREILQDCAGLENRHRRAVGPDDRGPTVVGRDREKARLERLAASVDRAQVVRQTALLEHDRNLTAVRRRPLVELDPWIRRGHHQLLD